jgi:oligopeptide/dipeptide ABC transporter ATP-binding protein
MSNKSDLRTTRSEAILDVENLKTYFYTDDGVVKAVDGVNFEVYPGEVLGLVGESGCGKSVTSLSIMRLVDSPGKIEGGRVLFEGRDILNLPISEMTAIRGNHLSMIFQQPQSCLNPVFNIGDQIVEVFQTHNKIDKKSAWKKAVDLLKLVGIPDAEKKAFSYPHEISGGQAQRVMIAMALALSPKLLIADEPTTALDVTIQAQILDLLIDLQKRLGTAVILITHDMGVIAEIAQRVAVMYAGVIIEQASVNTLFEKPLHPYTQGLLASIPVLGVVKEKLDAIPGNVPNLIGLPPGCRFASRCRLREKYRLDICTRTEPDLNENSEEHLVRCWLYQNAEGHRAPLAKQLA